MTEPVEVTYRRVRKAPQDLVFACMTTPDHLAQSEAVVTHQHNVPASHRTPSARAGHATSLDRFDEYLSTLTTT